MPNFNAPAGSLVSMKVRVDKRPYLAGFQTPPHNSNWENVIQDPDGMGESRDFRMPAAPGAIVSFNGTFDEQIGPNDPVPQATYVVKFSSGGVDKVVVPKGVESISRQYTFAVT